MTELKALFKCAAGMTYCEERVVPRHQHFDYELILVERGHYGCEHNAVHHQLKEGDGVLLRPGDWHTDYIGASTTYLAINFILKAANDTGRADLIRSDAEECLLRFSDRDGTVLAILGRLLNEMESESVASVYLIDAYTQEVFWSMVKLLPEDVLANDYFDNADKIQFRKRLFQFFQQNIHRTLSLEEMADHLHTSLRSLNNRSRDYLGVSPVKAFTKMKMEYALELLTQTDMTIKEVSEYLGFQNPYHFSKVFKRIFQRNPSFLRNQLRS